MRHELKCDPGPFVAIRAGYKTAEFPDGFFPRCARRRGRSEAAQ